MAHQHAGGQLSHLGLLTGDRPGEDVDLHAALSEPSGYFDDVDVKAACVAGPRLLKR